MWQGAQTRELKPDEKESFGTEGQEKRLPCSLKAFSVIPLCFPPSPQLAALSWFWNIYVVDLRL